MPGVREEISEMLHQSRLSWPLALSFLVLLLLTTPLSAQDCFELGDFDFDGVCEDVDCAPDDPLCSIDCSDVDGDGICADADNCVRFANALQSDADGDGIGDACDSLQILPMQPTWSVQAGASTTFGSSVTIVGDVNGDGFDDVVVSDPAFLGTGRVFAYYGSPTGPSTAADWTFDGENVEDEFGHRVRPAGDVNGDGFDDLIVGAPGWNNDRGRAYVFLGSSSGLNGPAFWIASGLADGDRFGEAVASAGDQLGDGTADVAVGAPGADDSDDLDTGAIFLFFSSRESFDDVADLTRTGSRFRRLGSELTSFIPRGLDRGPGLATERFSFGAALDGFPSATLVRFSDVVGRGLSGLPLPSFTPVSSVTFAGDVDGDGIEDFVTAGLEADQGSLTEEGGIQLVPGNEFLTLGDSSSNLSFTAAGVASFERLGSSLAAAGDVNGDSLADVIVSSHPLIPTDPVRTLIFTGSPTTGLDATPLTLVDGNGADLGGAVAGNGDLTGDGFSDVIIGVPGYAGGGTVFAYFGEGACSSRGGDADHDGVCADSDCDDSNPFCATACVDEDGDGRCFDFDCDDDDADCGVDCSDDDGDGLCGDADCDDTSANCGAADCALDGDADTVFDCADNCPFDANQGQLDQDGDGAGDPCDPDRDGDGVDDITDNCPTVPNAEQVDLNLDGVGDVCESSADSDGDGVFDALDSCPTVPNSAQGGLVRLAAPGSIDGFDVSSAAARVAYVRGDALRSVALDGADPLTLATGHVRLLTVSEPTEHVLFRDYGALGSMFSAPLATAGSAFELENVTNSFRYFDRDSESVVSCCDASITLIRADGLGTTVVQDYVVQDQEVDAVQFSKDADVIAVETEGADIGFPLAPVILAATTDGTSVENSGGDLTADDFVETIDAGLALFEDRLELTVVDVRGGTRWTWNAPGTLRELTMRGAPVGPDGIRRAFYIGNGARLRAVPLVEPVDDLLFVDSLIAPPYFIAPGGEQVIYRSRQNNGVPFAEYFAESVTDVDPSSGGVLLSGADSSYVERLRVLPDTPRVVYIDRVAGVNRLFASGLEVANPVPTQLPLPLAPGESVGRYGVAPGGVVVAETIDRNGGLSGLFAVSIDDASVLPIVDVTHGFAPVDWRLDETSGTVVVEAADGSLFSRRLDFIDSDGDGIANVCDCAPGDGSIFGAVEVDGLVLDKDGSTTLASWQQSPAVDSYELYSASVGILDQVERSIFCVEQTTETIATDPTVPNPGSAIFYLVAGRIDVCDVSLEFGSTSAGARRGFDLTAATCP